MEMLAETKALLPLLLVLLADARAMLYPRPSATRDVRSLDGLWNFRLADRQAPLLGLQRQWYRTDLAQTGEVVEMPVPSSYNDIGVEARVRDHVGLAWYDRRFHTPPSLSNSTRVKLRFGSVNYAAQVWVNGALVAQHDIGHLPFEADVTDVLHRDGRTNLLSVAVDNTLDESSVPQGATQRLPSDAPPFQTSIVQTYTFDFFNYAGIHRPVLLYTVPRVHVRDVLVRTDVLGDTGEVQYSLELAGLSDEVEEEVRCEVRLFERGESEYEGLVAGGGDDDYQLVQRGRTAVNGTLRVPLARLWWPRLMHPDPGYLYRLQVRVFVDEELTDVYWLPVGIRSLCWDNDTLTLNEAPVYLAGFGRHEDSDVRGKGLDLAVATRDYRLLAWVGANCYRTSHYPYAEELMDMADRQGIMIIDECPAVDTDKYNEKLLENHKRSLSELIARDKNHASVIAWSVANEPRSQLPEADDYYRQVCEHARLLDPTRPLTAAIAQNVDQDKAAQHLDIVSFNRYNAWYVNTGRLEMVTGRVMEEARAFRAKHNKPVIMSEYGADTYEGLHLLPEYVWSEDFQQQLLARHFRAFDQLRHEKWFIGEFLWNFADFKTSQTYTRVGGNKKGVFTRNRQPKEAAYLLRRRYHRLAHQLYQAPLPDDLDLYDIDHNDTVDFNYNNLNYQP